MRRRGAITTIAGNRRAVYVTRYTIEGRPMCLITTAHVRRRRARTSAGLRRL